jgi:hypothetical protein
MTPDPFSGLKIDMYVYCVKMSQFIMTECRTPQSGERGGDGPGLDRGAYNDL